MKYDICVFHEYMSRIFKFDYDVTRTMGILHKDLHKFMIITPSTRLTMKGILERKS